MHSYISRSDKDQNGKQNPDLAPDAGLIAQKKQNEFPPNPSGLQTLINNSPQVQKGSQLQQNIDHSNHMVAQRQRMNHVQGSTLQKKSKEEEKPLQGKFDTDNSTVVQQKEESNGGLPNGLKSGIENLSGYSMDDVQVHYNSSKPAQMQALAYAQGTDIHLSPGQEKHLPHEAWHVVQQKQGRVQPTANIQGKGMPVNDDPGLEQEADVMGAKAMSGGFAGAVQLKKFSAASATSQLKVIQRKDIDTAFGKFKTDKFVAYDGRGVQIILKFHPDESKVDAKKIAMVQSLKKTNSSGSTYALDPNSAKRTVPDGSSGGGYTIDRLSDRNTPVYGSSDLGSSDTLKNTPKDNNTTSDPTNVGTNATYELGHCFKEKQSDSSKKKHPAGLFDEAKGGKNKGESKIFETAALGLEGTDKDKYFGSVKWGYKMEGTDSAPTVTAMDIELVSMGTPSVNFLEPAKLWNAAKTRGTAKVTADPATVLKGDNSGTETLAKDKKLKQLGTVMWGTAPAIQAEVLNDDKSGTGKIVYIKVTDTTDTGDGNDTKDLPVPDVHVLNGPVKLKQPTPLIDLETDLPTGTRVLIKTMWHPLMTGNGEIKVVDGPHTGKEGEVKPEDWSKIKDES